MRRYTTKTIEQDSEEIERNKRIMSVPVNPAKCRYTSMTSERCKAVNIVDDNVMYSTDWYLKIKTHRDNDWCDK